jgi:putative FmdB family regulatory protein
VPIYEYQCDACGHQLEALQKISDAPLKTCPECHKDSLRKRVSAAAFRLKGSGWYETDFKNKKPSGQTGEAPPAKGADKADKKESTGDKAKSTESGGGKAESG